MIGGGLAMDWLNYKHLHYFWVIAREGSIQAACKKLYLAQPTLSHQLKQLEQSLKTSLFLRQGRGLVLTDVGRLVFSYADDIFSLGEELQDALKGRPTGRPLRLAVGVADVVPKLITYRLLEVALRLPEPVHIVCHDDKPDRLLARLSVHELDLVLSDAPISPHVSVRAFSHLLGECGIVVFGTRELAAKYAPGFPASLDGAPMLLPAENTSLRRALDNWFDGHGLRPLVRGEFDDSALLKAFGEAGAGLFAGPVAIEAEIRRQYGVQVVGRVEDVRERFYAISVERRLKHPAVLAISQAAKQNIFGPQRTE